MLIIEGTDLAGKTTFCQKLLAHLPDHVYSHYTKLPFQHDRFWHYVQSASKYHVQDRFHMSEPVYTKVRGDKTPLNKWYDELDAVLKWHFCAYTVLLIPSERLIRHRWRAGEMYNIEQVLAANYVFHEFRNRADYVIGFDNDISNYEVEAVCAFYTTQMQKIEELKNSPYSVTLP